jgi:hypothetical protein
MLKFINLEQARFRVDAGESEQPRNDSRRLGSSLDRPTIYRRGKIGWNAACASRAAPARLLQKAARAMRRRGSGVAILSGSANPRSFPRFQRVTKSTDRLAALVAVDDWDLIVAFVAPDVTGDTKDTIGSAIGAGESGEVR